MNLIIEHNFKANLVARTSQGYLAIPVYKETFLPRLKWLLPWLMDDLYCDLDPLGCAVI